MKFQFQWFNTSASWFKRTGKINFARCSQVHELIRINPSWVNISYNVQNFSKFAEWVFEQEHIAQISPWFSPTREESPQVFKLTFASSCEPCSRTVRETAVIRCSAVVEKWCVGRDVTDWVPDFEQSTIAQALCVKTVRGDGAHAVRSNRVEHTRALGWCAGASSGLCASSGRSISNRRRVSLLSRSDSTACNPLVKLFTRNGYGRSPQCWFASVWSFVGKLRSSAAGPHPPLPGWLIGF